MTRSIDVMRVSGLGQLASSPLAERSTTVVSQHGDQPNWMENALSSVKTHSAANDFVGNDTSPARPAGVRGENPHAVRRPRTRSEDSKRTREV